MQEAAQAQAALAAKQQEEEQEQRAEFEQVVEWMTKYAKASASEESYSQSFMEVSEKYGPTEAKNRLMANLLAAEREQHDIAQKMREKLSSASRLAKENAARKIIQDPLTSAKEADQIGRFVR